MNEQVEMIRGLATHEAEIKHLQDDMDRLVKEMTEVKAALASIQNTLSEAKGGWRTLMAVGGAGASIGVGAAWLLDHFWK